MSSQYFCIFCSANVPEQIIAIAIVHAVVVARPVPVAAIAVAVLPVALAAVIVVVAAGWR